MTSLDIVCHEIGHAITFWRGGSMEYWRESGAMNEAYSDILGMLRHEVSIIGKHPSFVFHNSGYYSHLLNEVCELRML